MQRDLTVRAAQPVQPALDKLKAIADEIAARGWNEEARCWAALARAYGEAQEFAQAIECYRRASATRGGDAALELRDLEQLANYEARLALREWQIGAGDAPPPLERIGGAIRRLEWLISRDGTRLDERSRGGAACAGATEERFSLLGSAYKRRAWIDAGNRPRDLRSMHDAYAVAFDIACAAKRDTAYPLLNSIQSALVLRWQKVDGVPEIGTAERDAIHAAARELEAKAAAGADFWTSISLADHSLTVALLDRTLGAADEDRLAELYLAARRLGSPREFASVLDQLDFLAAMATNETIRDPLKRVALRASGGGDALTRGGGSGPPASDGPRSPAPAEAGAGAAPRGPKIPKASSRSRSPVGRRKRAAPAQGGGIR